MNGVRITPGRAVLVAAAAAIGVTGLLVYGGGLTPEPDNVAADQLGSLAVTILEHPAKVTAYRICNQKEPCFAQLKHAPRLEGYPEQGAISSVPRSTYADLQRIVFNGAHYEQPGGFSFFPTYAFKITAADGTDCRIIISPQDQEVRVVTHASAGDIGSTTWLSTIGDPDSLARLETELFGGSKSRSG